jgi:hemerythrin
MDWDKQYSVGIHELDEQHKTLLECVSAVEQSVIGGDSPATVQSALARLTSFAEVHFAVEESLMRIHDYPQLDEHVDEHRRFSDRLLALKERSLAADVSRDMIDFLRAWIGRHLPIHDKPFAFHFLKRSALRGREA